MNVVLVYALNTATSAEHGGYGSGTPSQRDRQYRKHRAEEAANAVREHTYMKAVASGGNQLMQTEQEKAYARRWKTTCVLFVFLSCRVEPSRAAILWLFDSFYSSFILFYCV